MQFYVNVTEMTILLWQQTLKKNYNNNTKKKKKLKKKKTSLTLGSGLFELLKFYKMTC